MMSNETPRLYMLMLGATVPGRFTEQHDIYFGIGSSLEELRVSIRKSWPEAKVHIDAWRRVTRVGDHMITVIESHNSPGDASESSVNTGSPQLFFINLGGYKEGEFDEFHYKVLAVGADKGEAVRISKQTAFYKHTSHGKANSHIDDKYGVDVDDIYEIRDILSPEFKSRYSLQIQKLTDGNAEPDPIHLGYFKLEKLEGFA
jgi:hypothetical protein